MAKITAPFLALGASGTIADTLVASKWKGRPYMRQHVIPANPNSTGQQSTRNAFTVANEIWKVGPALFIAPWNLFAQGQVLTGRNAFMGAYVRDNRGQADLTNMLFSPGAKGGLPPNSIAVTPGSNQLTIDFTNPSAPTGWTLDSAIAAAILDADPETTTDVLITAAEDAVSQAQVILSGLTASVQYDIGAWLQWTKPDGSTAYSVSTLDTGTPTV